PAYRHDRLIEELETLFLERAVDARDPLHLLMPLGGVPFLIDVNAIAPEVLRDVAGDIDGAHERTDALAAGFDRNEADADADLHRAIEPCETIVGDRGAQAFGDLH